MIIVENEGENGGGYDRSKLNAPTSTERTGSTTTKNYAPLDRVDDFSAESSEIYTDTKPAVGVGFGEEKHKTALTQTVPQQQSSQTMMEGHLFQDAVQKNNPPPIMSGRGV